MAVLPPKPRPLSVTLIVQEGDREPRDYNFIDPTDCTIDNRMTTEVLSIQNMEQKTTEVHRATTVVTIVSEHYVTRPTKSEDYANAREITS